MISSDYSILANDEACRSFLDGLPAGVVVLDAGARIRAANVAWQRLAAECGIGDGDYLAVCAHFDRDAPSDLPTCATLVRDVLAGVCDAADGVHSFATASGRRWLRIVIAALAGAGERSAVVTHIDITAAGSAGQSFFDLVSCDVLTGLPGRPMFLDRLNHALLQARREGRALAVLAICLDRLKVIVDTLGQEAGDQLLAAAVRRLQQSVRDCDSVGRLGSDELGIILAGIDDAQEAARIARRIVGTLGEIYPVADKELYTGVCIGIAVFPDDEGDSADAARLLRSADAAMLQAREQGRNTWRFHTPAMNERAVQRLQVDAELRLAISRSEFELYYQPMVDCGSGRIVGAEALLRWNHPQRGLVPPLEFVSVLEDAGLIGEVGGWVVHEACRQLKGWLDAGLGPLSVAVNLSARQLDDGPALLATVRSALQSSGVPPALLELELTETVLMANAGQVVAILAELRQLGVKISVDDFGTGYSSLAYLKRFPLDMVKVDRSFVQDITADRNDASITRAVITMAHQLKMKVVAEGVETEGQMSLLAANQCDEIQGYFFSRPVPAAEMERMLREQRSLPPQAAGDGKPLRTLLLVDDEENILSSLKRLLRRDGYRILTAGGGAEALELLAQHAVDVIISDQRMPNMTGVEFLRRVKTLYPATVRMVLSGYTELQSITDAINEGAIYKFLTKPWDDELLRANIEEAFRHKEMGDENLRLGRELEQANRELAAANEQLTALLHDKQRQLVLGGASLEVMREILQEVPLPVIGVDEDGLIVFANLSAESLLSGGPLLGADAVARLPESLHCLLPPGEVAESEAVVDGRTYRVLSRAMHGRASGRLLLVLRKGEN